MTPSTVSQEVCSERHRRIDECLERLDTGQQNLSAKADKQMGLIAELRLMIQELQASTDDAAPPACSSVKRRRVEPFVIGGGAGALILIIQQLLQLIFEKM